MLSLTLRHAAVTEFLAGQFAASRVTATVAALDVVACLALLSDICARLRPFTAEEGLAVPYATHVAVTSA